jgi:hypothetical protein
MIPFSIGESVFWEIVKMAEVPAQIAIYGSSLFLTAVANLLLNDRRYQPLFFSESTAISTILCHNPILLLYEEASPPTDIPVFLAADVVVAEITPDKNQMIIFQPHASQQCIPIHNSAEFQTKISPFIKE